MAKESSIVTYNSATTTNTPVATLPQGELAVNTADKKLWVGDGASPIVLLGSAVGAGVTTGHTLVYNSVTKSWENSTALSFSGTAATFTGTITAGANAITGNSFKIGANTVLSGSTLGSTIVTSSLTTVGALNSGSITTGFGTINNAAAITGTTLTGTTSGVFGDMTITTGSITSTSGDISFDNENLTTTGAVNGATSIFTTSVTTPLVASISGIDVTTGVAGNLNLTAAGFGNATLGSTDYNTTVSAGLAITLTAGTTAAITAATNFTATSTAGTATVRALGGVLNLSASSHATLTATTGQATLEALAGNVDIQSTGGNIILAPQGAGDTTIIRTPGAATSKAIEVTNSITTIFNHGSDTTPGLRIANDANYIYYPGVIANFGGNTAVGATDDQVVISWISVAGLRKNQWYSDQNAWSINNSEGDQLMTCSRTNDPLTNRLRLSGLPTSPTGLTTGTIYRSSAASGATLLIK